MKTSLKLSAAMALLVLQLTVPAVAQAAWGSIAIDPTTEKIGISRNQSTAARAKTKALNECGERHCKVALWVANGYGAVVQKKNGVYISGIGNTRNLAFRAARERANEQSAPPVAWVFSGYS